jgi:hypothetical protein
VALNDNDRQWIRGEIESASKSWFARTMRVLPTALIIALGFFVLREWSEYIDFRGRTSERLGRIEQGIASLKLQGHASLPSASFQAALPEIKTVLATAKKDQIRVGPTVVNELQQRFLESDSKATDYWPAVAAFINYRSSLTSNGPVLTFNPLAGTTSTLPRCTDQLPHPATLAEDVSPGEQTVRINKAYYENCRFQLDSPDEDARISAFAKGNPGLTLKNCLVVYNGGPVELRLGPWPLMFENCRWEINVSGTPPETGQKVTRTLLAGNPDSFRFPSL